MKKIILFVFTFLFCQINYGQNLKIKIFNKTGFDIDSVSIGSKYIGAIKKGSSVKILDCNEIILQDGIPYGLPGGIILNETTNTELIGLCGTGRKTITRGYYKFDITAYKNEFGYRLFWHNHKQVGRL